MPRCDGRPGQQCARNDNAVRFTQGDLWLCADCEEFRFPTVNATSARNTTTKNKPGADTMSGTSKSEKVKSKRKSKTSNRKATSTGNDSESDTDDLLQNAQCSCCLGVIDSSARATCAICAGMYSYSYSYFIRTRSSATAEKQRVSCPHGGRVGLDPQAPSPSTPSGYTYAYG